MSRRALILPILLLLAAPVQAQDGGGLQSSILDLFRFNSCPDPLCLTVDDLDRQRDFVHSAAVGNLPLITFLGTSIGTSVADVPISNASSGVIFTFEGGVPTRQDISTGPIYAERAQTVGAKRFLAGANLTATGFSSLRGVSLDDISFTFTPLNVGDEALGDPGFENDMIQVDLDLDVNLMVGQLFAVYGVSDRIDVGISIPLVRTSLSGTSTGTVVQSGSTSPYYFGTGSAPSSTATASIDESAMGIGDIAARVKVNLSRMETGAFGILADVRFPTGSQEDLLGSGSLALRGLGIVSARWGSFSPHINAGYLFWAEDWLNDALLATVGFDQLVTPWATLAFDLLSQWKVGDALQVPPPIQYTEPSARTVTPTNIPDASDNRYDASLGIRFNHGSGVRGIVNALIPINDGGLRPAVAWTLGVEYNGLLGGS